MANVTDNAGIDFHLPAELKPMVEQAAALRGQSVSEFALATVADNAQRVIQQYQILKPLTTAADLHDDDLNWEELGYDPILLSSSGQVTIRIHQRGKLLPMVQHLDDE